MINNAGELVQYIQAAVQQHGATPHTEVRLRVGGTGLEYRISGLKAVQDQRGFSLVLEGALLPETGG